MVALACWRRALRGVWRQVLALALLVGLLGGVALGAVAGARRTATATATATAIRAVPGRHQSQRRVRERAGNASRDGGHTAL